MEVALLGFGVVGKKVYEQIKDKYHVVKILDKKIETPLFTSNIEEIINIKPEVVIECLPNIEIAFDYQKKILQNGINLVSSNKAIIQKHYKELVNLAKENNCTFSFEAAVGGGIPNLHNLCDTKLHDEIKHIKGIMNGTTNYILDSIFSNDMEYLDALNNAITLGYAEADYSSDVDGIDVAYKIALSLNLAFDTVVDKNDIVCFGIRYLNSWVIDYARKNNLIIKLIGYGDRENAFVLPILLKKSDVFANISLNYNCIEIGSIHQESIKFIGQGAGGEPTADAMILDLCRPFPKLNIDNIISIKNNKKYRFLISNGINNKIIDLTEVNKLKDLVEDGYFVGGLDD